LRLKFWHDRWRLGQTGFHQTEVDRSLQRFWPALGLDLGSRVFVPLCGKSLDLLWLRDRGLDVTGVEISAVALESLCMENGIPARRRPLDRFDAYEAGALRLMCGDFFELTQDLLGPVAAVYDRAALISWAPELRAAYADHVAALTTSGTQTLLVALEYAQDEMKGPPFSVSADDVQRLYGRAHQIVELGRSDILASEPRLSSRGITRLHEACYQLVRL
jgi:thiopurine S-methyltransferase